MFLPDTIDHLFGQTPIWQPIFIVKVHAEMNNSSQAQADSSSVVFPICGGCSVLCSDQQQI